VAPVRVRQVVLLATVAVRLRRSLAVSLRIRPTVIASTPSAREDAGRGVAARATDTAQT
jgi:hypothetical protein